MATVSSTPSTYVDFFETTLKGQITSSQTSGIVIRAPKDNSGANRTFSTFEMLLEFSRGDKREIVSAGGFTQDGTTGDITLSDVTRDVNPDDGTDFTTGGNGQVWPDGTKVKLTVTSKHMAQMTRTDTTNTFSENQTIADTKKVIFAAAGCEIYTDDGGTNLKFDDGSNSTVTLSTLAASGNDEKVGISSNDTTPDYLLNKITGGDGITVTEIGDGGDEDLDIDVDLATDPGLEFSTNQLRVKTKASGGITRDSDGLSVNESELSFDGKGKKIMKWAIDFTPTQFNGAANTAVKDDDYVYMSFDQSSDENAVAIFVCPDDWTAASTITAQIFWAEGTGLSTNVKWNVAAGSMTDGDAMQIAYGTAQSVTDAGSGTANDLRVTAATSAITVSGSPNAGDIVKLLVTRDANDAADTLAADAELIGVRITYT